MKASNYVRRAQRGGVLISALAFVAVSSMLVVGTLTVAMSHYARAKTEADYEAALALAEAGVNYEFREISVNAANADQLANAAPIALAGGTFTVYCTNKDGTTPWVAPNNLYVVSTGTIHNVSRTAKVSVKGYGLQADYAVFAVSKGTLNGGPHVTGSVGTNGVPAAGGLLFNGSPVVSSQVVFNGASSGFIVNNSNQAYTVVHNAQPVVWPTVTQIANAAFPSGGLPWLSTHNDNALCNKIVNSTILNNGNGNVTLVGKAGGANYYLTSLLFNGNGGLIFDNTLGPINIWMGPLNGNGQCILNGGSSNIKMSTDPSKACKIYSAMSSTVTLNGSVTLDAGIYAYDMNGANPIGTVTNNGTPTLNGPLIANTVTLNGNPPVKYVNGYFGSNNVGYYGYDDQWLEVNGM